MCHPDTESIYKKYAPQLYSFVTRFISNDTEAVTLIIEWAFAQYENKTDKVQMTERGTGIYLKLIARNLITNYFHSKVSHG